MLNTRFIWISSRPFDVCVFLLNAFYGLPAIFLCLCWDGDLNIKVIFLIMGDWRADLDLGFLVFFWKPNCHCWQVCSTSSCTLSHALTIAPPLLALRNPVYTNTHGNALTEREYLNVWKSCKASYWILQSNLNSSLDFVLENLHFVVCMILHLFRGPNFQVIPCRPVQESRMYPRGCKIPGSAGI